MTTPTTPTLPAYVSTLLEIATRDNSDPRSYPGVEMPRVGDTVAPTWGRDRSPGVVTRVSLPTVYFTLPDGTEYSTGVQGMVLVSRK